MPTLLAKNASVLVTMDDGRRELSNAGLFARDGMIEQVGPTDQLPQRADLVLDLSGQIVLPGFVNTHHHLDQTLTRNLPAAQNNNLFPWLKSALSRVGQPDPGGVAVQHAHRAGGARRVRVHDGVRPRLCVQERLPRRRSDRRRQGDRRALPRVPRLHVAQGIRGGLPPDDCVEDEQAILTDCVRAIETYHDRSRGAMTRVVLGPCSPFSVSTDLLKESATLARAYQVPLHTHLCETMDEERYTLERYQLRPVAWMATLGWLGDRRVVRARHPRERRRDQEMARAGVGAAHCPSSNMRLASGIAPVEEVSGRGRQGRAGRRWVREQRRVEHPARGETGPVARARLRLGLLPPEGPRTLFLLSQSHPLRAHEWMTAREVLEIATRGGAAVLGRDDIGSLEVGKCADFFSIDLNTVDYAGRCTIRWPPRCSARLRRPATR